ncbi:hypothetical protein BE20_16110 [Sorangium cellulosum]|nr:hypothetical protein BE20_16110 [Sorangium cellulosum]
MDIEVRPRLQRPVVVIGAVVACVAQAVAVVVVLRLARCRWRIHDERAVVERGIVLADVGDAIVVVVGIARVAQPVAVVVVLRRTRLCGRVLDQRTVVSLVVDAVVVVVSSQGFPRPSASLSPKSSLSRSGQLSQSSPLLSSSRFAWLSFLMVGQLSQASPYLSPSPFSCSGLCLVGQLSLGAVAQSPSGSLGDGVHESCARALLALETATAMTNKITTSRRGCHVIAPERAPRYEAGRREIRDRRS